MIFVYASLTDKNGTVVPENGITVEFYVEGDAILLNQGEINTEAGISKALIKIGNSKEQIKICLTDSLKRFGSLQFKPI